MLITQLLSALALRPLVDAALRAVEARTGLPVRERARAACELLRENFTDHSRRVEVALELANRRAWRALEVALAGETLLNALDRKEDRALREQIREALDAGALGQAVADSPGARSRCLAQLRDARRRGRLTDAGEQRPEAVFERASEFARFDDPADLLDAEWRAVEGIGDALRADYPDLAALLARRDGGGLPLIAVAARYYFRRAAEKDEALFRGLALSGVEAVGRGQAVGFDRLLRAVDEHGDRLEALLEEVREVVYQTHEGVLDIRAEQHRQGERFADLYREVLDRLERLDRLDRRAIRPGDTLSLRSDEERRVVKALIARYRELPAGEKDRLPALLNAVGKLETVAGDYGQAEQDFRAVADLVPDDPERAEAHYNAYLAALERRGWDAALAHLGRAAALDAERYAPFPPGDHEPVRILGAGGFGVAFLCRNTHSEGLVVIKSLLPEALDAGLAAVFAEARALEELSHPAVIRLRTCGFADFARTRPYMMMDYFDGESLDEHVRTRGVLPVRDLVPVARLVAQGMGAAHARRILHRDLKPKNLMVRRGEAGWSVKVIDFGLAIRHDVIERSVRRGSSLGLSILGSSVAGTLEYAAPEQVGRAPGVAAGPYTDVYGFGKTCCFALFGTTQPQRRHWRAVPEGLAELLERCTDEDPKGRPADFGEVLAALETVDPDAPVAPQTAAGPTAEELVEEARGQLGRREYDLAVASASEAIRLDPSRAPAYVVRAEAHRRRGDADRALADAGEAVLIDPRRPTAFVLRADVYRKRGDFVRALVEATEAIRVDASHALAFAIRADCRRATGDRDGALADAGEAIRLDPARKSAHELATRVLRHLTDPTPGSPGEGGPPVDETGGDGRPASHPSRHASRPRPGGEGREAKVEVLASVNAPPVVVRSRATSGRRGRTARRMGVAVMTLACLALAAWRVLPRPATTAAGPARAASPEVVARERPDRPKHELTPRADHRTERPPTGPPPVVKSPPVTVTAEGGGSPGGRNGEVTQGGGARPAEIARTRPQPTLLDLGSFTLNKAGRSWTTRLPGRFEKVEVAFYRGDLDDVTLNAAWDGHLQINGKDVVRFVKAVDGNVFHFRNHADDAYYYRTNDYKREKAPQFIDVTRLVRPGENEFYYYHEQRPDLPMGVVLRITVEEATGQDQPKK